MSHPDLAYVVRRPPDWKVVGTAPLLVVIVGLAWLTPLGDAWPPAEMAEHPWVVLPLLALAGLATVGRLRRSTLALAVDPTGVTLGGRVAPYGFYGSTGGQPTETGRVHAPWPSVAAVLLYPDGPTGGQAVGIRLRPGAPLPQGVPAVVRNATGVAEPIRRPLGGVVIDRRRLVEAVAAFGHGVPVLEAAGERDWPLRAG